MSMVYHHLTDPTVVARECHRVLRQGGYKCIRNGTRESDFPHRHSFPALRALIDSELPSRRDIASVFTAGGLTPVVHASRAARVHRAHRRRGTEGSNPPSSSGESAANRLPRSGEQASSCIQPRPLNSSPAPLADDHRPDRGSARQSSGHTARRGPQSAGLGLTGTRRQDRHRCSGPPHSGGIAPARLAAGPGTTTRRRHNRRNCDQPIKPSYTLVFAPRARARWEKPANPPVFARRRFRIEMLTH
jgi:hypothetical protein